jgi:hypothetical protein
MLVGVCASNRLCNAPTLALGKLETVKILHAPNPKSADIGLRKTLNEAENPKLTNEITQPAIIA